MQKKEDKIYMKELKIDLKKEINNRKEEFLKSDKLLYDLVESLVPSGNQKLAIFLSNNLVLSNYDDYEIVNLRPDLGIIGLIGLRIEEVLLKEGYEYIEHLKEEEEYANKVK